MVETTVNGEGVTPKVRRGVSQVIHVSPLGPLTPP